MAASPPLRIARAEHDLCIVPRMANRHGLIAGATGTGKTVTLRVLAEQFSRIGVPVFLADAKGDLSGGKPMFRIINTRILELTVAVPSAEMGTVHVGQLLTFLTDAISGKTFTGKVMFINPVVNEADRSVKVVAEVENANEELKGGLFVKGRIVTGKRNNILSIPRSALLSWDVAARKGELYVVNGDIANRQAVRTGSVMGDFVEITSGLAPGDPVVTRGGFNLKDGDRVNVTQVNGG